MSQPAYRSRRSVLAVPGSSDRMLEKAAGLPADVVFLDLEDAVAPDAKPEARRAVAAALLDRTWRAPTRTVRVNDWSTPWTFRDVAEVVGTAGAAIDGIVLPKVTDAGQVRALDLLLTQLERESDLPVGRIEIEPQIEDARGLTAIDAIAAASDRVTTLVFGPGDFMASMGMRTMNVGDQPPGYHPGDAYHHVLSTILVAARARGLQAIDGPYTRVRDADGFVTSAGRTAALGYDGKWVLHPDQIEAANRIFGPDPEEFRRAAELLQTYRFHTSGAGGARGAVVIGDEMVDEAGAKIAERVLARGLAAGLQPPVFAASDALGSAVRDEANRAQ